MFWFRRTWPSCYNERKYGISIGLKLSEDLLELLVEVTSGRKKVDEHW